MHDVESPQTVEPLIIQKFSHRGKLRKIERRGLLIYDLRNSFSNCRKPIPPSASNRTSF